MSAPGRRRSTRRRKSSERRQSVRLEVYGGNAEVTHVEGSGRIPAERARIIDWSQGGLLLRVSSPRRRLWLLRREPCLEVGDRLSLTLRLPPAYRDIAACAEVVRAGRARREPEFLLVGVAFDPEATPRKSLESLAKLLEPRQRASTRLKRRSA